MPDVFTPEKRSEVMSLIRSKWTKPEKIIHNHLKGRKIRHEMHPNMTGNPDILLKENGIAVFIHGCFWHKCPKCFREPENRKDYWLNKVNNNVKRHKHNVRLLKEEGRKAITIWEHDVRKNLEGCLSRLVE